MLINNQNKFNSITPSNTISLQFLDGIRAIAALYVLISHIWYQIWPAANPPFGYSQRPTGLTLAATSWLYYGHFAVVVFIVLSGFCLMLPVIKNKVWLRGGVLEFFKRRSRRLLPPYYLALLLSLLLIYLFINTKTGSQWDISIPVTAVGIVANALMLQDFIAVTQINYVFWSLAVIWQLYLVFPLLVVCWRRLGGLGTTVMVALLSYSTVVILEIIQIQDIPPQYIGLIFNFVLGMLAATIIFSEDRTWLQLRWQIPWEIILAILSLSIILLTYIWGFDLVEANLAFIDTLCALATFSLILAAARPGRNLIRTVLSWRHLVFIGTFSYSLYLIHAPLIQLLWQYGLQPLHLGAIAEFGWLIGIGTPLILLVSYIFFYCCERPFLNQRRIITANKT